MRGEDESMSATGCGDNASALEDMDPETGQLISDETRPLAELPTPDEIKSTRLREFLKGFTPRRDYDPRLSITRERKKILATIEESRFCIIQGGTGCGKTTQVI